MDRLHPVNPRAQHYLQQIASSWNMFVKSWNEFPVTTVVVWKEMGRSPGGPMAKTPSSGAGGPGFDTWSGNWLPPAATKSSRATAQDPLCHKEDPTQPNKQIKMLKKEGKWVSKSTGTHITPPSVEIRRGYRAQRKWNVSALKRSSAKCPCSRPKSWFLKQAVPQDTSTQDEFSSTTVEVSSS